MHIKFVSAVSALAMVNSAGLAQTSTWDLTTDGFWSIPTNWSPTIAPINSTNNAVIPNNGLYTITIGGNFDTNDIDNMNPDATIELQFGRQHELFGDFENEGTYVINSTSAAAQTSLFWKDSASLNGSGSIVLNGLSTRARLIIEAGSTLTQGAGHTIEGFGQLFGDINNNGTIGANSPFNTLDFRFGNINNNSIIGATNDGILHLNFDTLLINQTPSGVIRADGGSVNIQSATISGGTVEGINGGVVTSTGSPIFDDLETNGDVLVDTGRTLNLSDTITNSGEILVNPNNIAAVTTLDADNDVLLTGSGVVKLNGVSTRAQITTAGGGVITNDVNHTIDGFGRIFGSVVNNGLITANVPGVTLLCSGENKTNNGTMSADDGILEINNITLDQTAGGSLDANRSNIRYNGPEIEGGTLTSGTGIHEVVFVTELRSVVNEAQVHVTAGDALQIRGSITNNGNILINPTNIAAQTNLRFMDSGSFNGNGTVTLNGVSTRAQIVSVLSTFTITNGPNHTIQGFGRIDANMINNGQILAEEPGQELFIDNVEIMNNNTIQSNNNAILEISTGSSVIQNSGASIAANDAEVELQNTLISGGFIESSGTGVFNVQGGTTRFENVTNEAMLIVEQGRTLELSGTHTNNETINVNPGNVAASTFMTLQNDLTLDGSGELKLSGFSIRARINSDTLDRVLTNGPSHTISGIGTINTPLINQGTIAPGLSAGTLSASSPITLTDSSALEIEIAGPLSHDAIDSSSTFQADGTLDISLIDGFVPTTSFVATIVTADAGVSGTFDTLIAPPPPADPRLSYKIGYFADEIRIGAVCDSDIDFNGEIDFFDISTFLSQFTAMDPAADFNQDGEFDFFDISLFLSSFANGCP
ncbi:MAG: hypothetical protein JJ974_03250 [Phycisphaerales bacterium]|nr:hypothetical protein [Phycisphaerales bacterium]